MEGKEVEVDAICDGEEVLIPGIMEHIERAGVHSGDSMAIYPGLNLTEERWTPSWTTRPASDKALGVRGLMNIQFVIVWEAPPTAAPPACAAPDARRPAVYVIEVNPRSSRTIPFISKVTGVPVVRLASGHAGKDLKEMGYKGGTLEAPAARNWRQGARLFHVQAAPVWTATWGRR